jgi:hypothetical protein
MKQIEDNKIEIRGLTEDEHALVAGGGLLAPLTEVLFEARVKLLLAVNKDKYQALK